MVNTYQEVAKIIEKSEREQFKSAEIIALLQEVKKSDKNFLISTIRAINNKEIKDLGISNIIVANRAFVQSCRQILLALREILLNKEELEKFNKMHDDKNEYLEIEDN